MTRIPVKSTRAPRPEALRTATNGTNPTGEGAMYSSATTAMLTGELDVLDDSVVVVAVELGADAYTPDVANDSSLDDIPDGAVRGQSTPLEQKRISDGVFS